MVGFLGWVHLLEDKTVVEQTMLLFASKKGKKRLMYIQRREFYDVEVLQ